jgi:hypothetical protein
VKQLDQVSHCGRLLSTFVDATNAYAKGAERAEWTDVTMVEIQAFLGLILYFGVLQLPQRRMAWSKSMFYVPYPSAVMAGKRFDQILNNWHWVTFHSCTEERQK